jgi:hypothetical protein
MAKTKSTRPRSKIPHAVANDNAISATVSRATVLAYLREASLATDTVRGLYSLKHELTSIRDSVGGEHLDWFSAFHEGVLDVAINATAAHVGQLIHSVEQAIEGEEVRS